MLRRIPEQGTVNPEYEDDFNFDENTFIDGAQ